MIIGVDPGKKGAWAVVSEDGRLVATGDLLNLSRAVDLAKLLAKSPSRVIGVVETGGIRPGQAHQFLVGRNVGRVEGALKALGVEVRPVTPQVWKYGLGIASKARYQERKKMARVFAKSVWPDAKFKRVDHAEAALIALWYVRRVLNAP